MQSKTLTPNQYDRLRRMAIDPNIGDAFDKFGRSWQGCLRMTLEALDEALSKIYKQEKKINNDK